MTTKNGKSRLRAPKGGIRVDGKTFAPGVLIPEKYRKQVEKATRPSDVAMGVRGLPPNAGRPILPHLITFSGMTTSLSRAYRINDEAMRHSVENAHMMLNDPMIAGPLFARQYVTSLFNWHIEPVPRPGS